MCASCRWCHFPRWIVNLWPPVNCLLNISIQKKRNAQFAFVVRCCCCTVFVLICERNYYTGSQKLMMVASCERLSTVKKIFLYRWTDLTYAKCLKRLEGYVKGFLLRCKKHSLSLNLWNGSEQNRFFFSLVMIEIVSTFDILRLVLVTRWVLTKSYKNRLDFCGTCYNKEINLPYWILITVVFF